MLQTFKKILIQWDIKLCTYDCMFEILKVQYVENVRRFGTRLAPRQDYSTSSLSVFN